MSEMMLGTYGVLCWLVFKKLRLIPVNTYTICTAFLIGIFMLAIIFILLLRFQPSTSDGRLYAITTPILPQVRGRVISVPVTSNVPLRKGDLLFEIDPTPYQFEVDRLEAAVAESNTNLGQVEQQLSAATAATEQARADLLASESEYDRQAQQELEQADASTAQVKAQLVLAQQDYERYKTLFEEGTVPRQKFEQAAAQRDRLQAQLEQAQAARSQAEEKLKSGGDKLQAARERLRQAEAQEREVKLEYESQSGGVNPELKQILAQLSTARWELSETAIRAPADGYVTQVMLRPGQMAVPFPVAPVMIFVHGEPPVLIASYPQNVITEFRPGLEAEVAFKAYPGEIFEATVDEVLPIIQEGQLAPTGQLRAATSESAPGRIPVKFKYSAEINALDLPTGAQAEVAVYTDSMQFLGILRKIILRIKSWENYLFLP
jgi:multidrug resistance efflux pump